MRLSLSAWNPRNDQKVSPTSVLNGEKDSSELLTVLEIVRISSTYRKIHRDASCLAYSSPNTMISAILGRA